VKGGGERKGTCGVCEAEGRTAVAGRETRDEEDGVLWMGRKFSRMVICRSVESRSAMNVCTLKGRCVVIEAWNKKVVSRDVGSVTKESHECTSNGPPSLAFSKSIAIFALSSAETLSPRKGRAQ